MTAVKGTVQALLQEVEGYQGHIRPHTLVYSLHALEGSRGRAFTPEVNADSALAAMWWVLLVHVSLCLGLEVPISSDMMLRNRKLLPT